MPRFRTTLLLAGKTATGIEVPPEVVEELGAGKKPPVRVTIADHSYRSTIAARGDRFLVGVSAENRAAAGVSAGDELEVKIELDSEPREVEVPAALAEAFAGEPDARRFFDTLSHSQKQWYVLPIRDAKAEETRARRVTKAIGMLLEGRKR
jgi:hypothetical protein